MKIKTEYGHLVDIFGICWWDTGETNLLGLPRNNGGLTLYGLTGSNKEKLEIIDPSIDWRAVHFQNRGHGIYHWALIEEKLLDDIQEYDPTAYQRFLEIIKSEGLVDEDFE